MNKYQSYFIFVVFLLCISCNIESKISSIKENERELINSISNQLRKWLKNKKKDVKKSKEYNLKATTADTSSK